MSQTTLQPVPIQAETGKNIVTLLNYLEKEPIFFGTPPAIIGALQSMGRIGGGVPDLPGWIDDLATSIEDPNPIIQRINRKGQTVYSRWYEMGEDGTVLTMAGNYLGFPIRFFGAFYQGLKHSDEDVNNYIKELEKRTENVLGDVMRKYMNMIPNVAEYYAPKIDEDGKIVLDEEGNPKLQIVGSVVSSPTADTYPDYFPTRGGFGINDGTSIPLSGPFNLRMIREYHGT